MAAALTDTQVCVRWGAALALDCIGQDVREEKQQLTTLFQGRPGDFWSKLMDRVGSVEPQKKAPPQGR